MNTLQRIESFANGNVVENRKALSRVMHRHLRDGYTRVTGCDEIKALAFADYVKGEITFQEYCDTSDQPPSRTL
jgi:hypothetical protein